jgi:hypothetical protein
MHEESNRSTISILGHAKGEHLAVLDCCDPGNSHSFGLRVRSRTNVLESRNSRTSRVVHGNDMNGSPALGDPFVLVRPASRRIE